MTWLDFSIMLLVYAWAGVFSTIMIVDICDDTYDMFTGKVELPKWAKTIICFTGIVWPVHLIICLVCLSIMFISLIIEDVKLHKAIKEYRENSKQKKENHDNA